MSYVWFNLVLESLGKKLNFESISNIYGNSFCKDPQKIVIGANPLVKNGGRNPHGGAAIAALAGKIKVTEVKEGNKIDMGKIFGGSEDVSWATDLMKKKET